MWCRTSQISFWHQARCVFFQTVARWIQFILSVRTQGEALILNLEVRRKICWDSGPVVHVASGSLWSLMSFCIYMISGTCLSWTLVVHWVAIALHSSPQEQCAHQFSKFLPPFLSLSASFDLWCLLFNLCLSLVDTSWFLSSLDLLPPPVCNRVGTLQICVSFFG